MHQKMPEAQTIMNLSNCLNYKPGSEGPCRWFLSYGAVLWYIRDRNMGKPFKQDFDISIFDGDDFRHIEKFLAEFSFHKKSQFLNDKNGKPFKMVFGGGAFDIDIFLQFKMNGYYWHTYDYYGEFKDIPRKGYVFKGIPCELFDADPYKYEWDERIPPVNFPPNYGHLLDIWYPGWFIPDARFGQSKAVKVVKTKNCKNLKTELK